MTDIRQPRTNVRGCATDHALLATSDRRIGPKVRRSVETSALFQPGRNARMLTASAEGVCGSTR